MFSRRQFMQNLALAAASTGLAGLARAQGASAPAPAGLPSPSPQGATRPNIIFILADDLGYGDLGCYGQKRIQTPHLDEMARQGMRFTDAYAGSTVCAPSRACLMTGMHTGHGYIRGNGDVSLRAEDRTVAELLKKAGYTTALIGKWGLGQVGEPGLPTSKGFDYSYGYLNHGHAHNYYPDHLWRNGERIDLQNVIDKPNPRGTGVASKKVEYVPDLMLAEALKFISDQKGKPEPFFLYFASTIPHANNENRNAQMEVPSDKPYSDTDWPQQQKNKAAMITLLDDHVGKLLSALKEQGIDERTLVIFSSDNGPHKEGVDPDFFDSNGPLRGIKRDLYEGGIRVPTIARYPGVIPAGKTSDQPWAFWDVMPTLASYAGAAPPDDIDGITMRFAFEGQTMDVKRYLYWEFHEGGFKQAARRQQWKAVRKGLQGPIELYDLSNDVGEQRDIAGEHPEIVAEFKAYLDSARTESERWNPAAGSATPNQPGTPKPPRRPGQRKNRAPADAPVGE